MILVSIIWTCLALVVGAVAKTRERSGFGWFVLAFLISPLLALIFVLVLRDLRAERLQKEAPDRLSVLAPQKVAVVWVAVAAGMFGLWAVAHFL